MKRSDWARQQGIRDLTAWRWFRAGPLPVPARQLPTGTIPVEEPHSQGRTALYARISSADRKDDRQRPVQRLQTFAREQGWPRSVPGSTGSGRIGVEHRDRRAGFGFERVEAALAAAGQRVVVVEEGEIPDDQMWDLPEILVSACGRRGGRRSARNCVKRAPEALACG